jgi:hypothetical protein
VRQRREAGPGERTVHAAVRLVPLPPFGDDGPS